MEHNRSITLYSSMLHSEAPDPYINPCSANMEASKEMDIFQETQLNLWVGVHHKGQCERDASIYIPSHVYLAAFTHIILYICHPCLRTLPLMRRKGHALWSGSLTIIATRWCGAETLTGSLIHYSINTLHVPGYETIILSLNSMFLPCGCGLPVQR